MQKQSSFCSYWFTIGDGMCFISPRLPALKAKQLNYPQKAHPDFTIFYFHFFFYFTLPDQIVSCANHVD